MAAPPKPVQGNLQHQIFRAITSAHVCLYRLTRGRVGGRLAGSDVLLLTTVGRKSAKLRTLPLLTLETDQGWAIVASYAGSDRHPSWYLNLRDEPAVEIHIGGRQLACIAETTESARHAELWPRFVDAYPDYALYQERTERPIPIIEVIPIEEQDDRQRLVTE